MSAARKAKEVRPPYFYSDVEVQVDPEDLEEAGWVYVGKGKGAEAAQPDEAVLVRLIREMHFDEHDGPMRWCQHALCREVEEPR